jgi:hypothetical protein
MKLLQIFLVILSVSASAQNFNISVVGENVTYNKKVIYKVVLDADSSYIIHSKKDSVSKAFEGNRRVKSIGRYILRQKNIDIKDPKLTKRLVELRDIKQKYSYYRTDTVRLSTETADQLRQLLAAVEKTPTDELEVITPGFIMFGEMQLRYHFTLPYNGQLREIRFTKTRQKYPLLYELISVIEEATSRGEP